MHGGDTQADLPQGLGVLLPESSLIRRGGRSQGDVVFVDGGAGGLDLAQHTGRTMASDVLHVPLLKVGREYGTMRPDLPGAVIDPLGVPSVEASGGAGPFGRVRRLLVLVEPSPEERHQVIHRQPPDNRI